MDTRPGLLLAEVAGLAGAVVAATLLSRRAVAPLALALASQRRFVADASHELRAPLTVLHTRVQLLARRARGQPADRLAGRLDELVADTRALGEVVDDLLVSAEFQHRPTWSGGSATRAGTPNWATPSSGSRSRCW